MIGPPNRGAPAKNIYTKSERPTVRCRGTWSSYEMVNLCNWRWYYREIQKHVGHIRDLDPLPGSQATVISTGFLPPPLPSSSALRIYRSMRNEILPKLSQNYIFLDFRVFRNEILNEQTLCLQWNRIPTAVLLTVKTCRSTAGHLT